MANSKTLLKPDSLTRQQRVFAETLARTGSPMQAAEAAYPEARHPSAMAAKAGRSLAVQGEVLRLTMDALQNRLVPLALGALERILTGDKVPAGAQVQASRLVLVEMAGATLAAATDGGSGKEGHEMSAAELRAEIAVLEQVAARRLLERRTIDLPAVEIEAETRPASDPFG